MTQPNARSVAWEALCGVTGGRGNAESLLRKLLAKIELPPVERRLAFELTLGTLRKRGYLDYGLNSLLKRPLKEHHSDLRELLRMGAYQILELDRVPAYAAVSQSVDLARERDTTKRAAGLVNAVLRRLSEGYPKPPDMERDPVGYLAVTGSHPRWLISRWLKRFGFEETERLCYRNNEAPDSFVFLNTRIGVSRKDITGLNLDGEPVPDFPDCFKLSRGTDLTSTEEYKRGLVYAADPATALAALVLKPQPGELILDACSAPGGKLCHLHRLAGGGLETVAVDSSPRRLSVLAENVSRLGIPTAIVNGDLLLAPLSRDRFDKILLDAPCSNTGVLRRRVEARWRRKPDDLKKLARLQLDLLDSVSRLAKTGGLLAYSTCSLEPEENEGVISSFLKRRGDYNRIPADERIDGNLRERFVDSKGYIRALPHRTNTDGVFVTLLRRVR